MADIRSELAEAFEAGRDTRKIGDRIGRVERGALSVPVLLDEAGNVAVAEGVMVTLDEMEAGPRRRAGYSRHAELDSFIGYVNRFKQAPSVIWADQAAFRVLAVFDYHPEGADPMAAGWARHRAAYECPRSESWKRWTSLDGRAQKQDAFADFIDENMADLASDDGYPKAADLLEMARDLRVHTVGKFERKINPTTGEGAMVCRTDNETTSSVIPRAFLIGISVFEGGDSYRVECRIRFAMLEGVPTFSFGMHRRAEIERDAFGAVRKAVAEKTSLPVFVGAPESS